MVKGLESRVKRREIKKTLDPCLSTLDSRLSTLTSDRERDRTLIATITTLKGNKSVTYSL